MLLLGAPPAHADPSVAFADSQPLVIDLTSCHQSCSRPVWVVNSATHGAPVDVRIVAAGAAANHLKVDKKPTTVPRGLKRIFVTVKKGAVASVGTLILSAHDGSLSREPVHLVGVLPPRGEVAPSTLRPGTFDVLSVRATSFVPSFFRPLPSVQRWWRPGLIDLFVFAGLCLAYWTLRSEDLLPLATVTAALAIVAGLTLLIFAGGLAALTTREVRHGQAVPSQSWSLSPPAPGRIDGNLTGDNGQIGAMVANRSTLTIKKIPSAGAYAGSLDTQPAGQSGTIKAAVTVRDWWPYAFAAVLIGVAVGWVISLFYVRRPSRQLQADAAATAAAIAHQESDWCERSAGQAWGEPYALAGYAQETITKILSSASSDPEGATTTLAALNDLGIDMEALRSQVAALGEERAALCAQFAGVVADEGVLTRPGWLARLEAPLNLAGQTLSQAQSLIADRRGAAAEVTAAADLATQLCDQLIQLKQRITVLPDHEREAEHSKWVRLLETVLTAADRDALEPLTNQVDALRQEVQAIAPAETVDDLAGQPFSGREVPAWFPAFDQLATQLVTQIPAPAAAAPASLPAANRDTLVTVTVTATELAENTSVHWEFSDGSRSAVFPAPPPGLHDTTMLSIRHSFATASGQASATVVREDGEPVAAWSGDVGSFSLAQRLRAGLGADDRVVAIVAGILAVASGMAALYLTAPAWGSAGDYIAALLWGSVTSEGVKLVVNSVGKRWPIAS